MAVRRMISKQVVQSDEFLQLTPSVQLLYFYLVLNADDCGVIDNAKSILSMTNHRPKSLLALVQTGFIIELKKSLYVVRDWENQNKVQASRKQKSQYSSDLERLSVDAGGRYYVKDFVDKKPTENRQPSDKMLSQDRGGEVRIGKGSRVEGSADVDTQPRPSEPRRLIFGTCQNVRLSLDEYDDLKNKFPQDYERLINRLSTYMAEKGKTYMNHYATLLRWGQEDEAKQKEQKQKKGGSFDWLRDAVLD